MTRFLRQYTRLAPVPLAPEVLLHQADEPIGLWEDTERGAGTQQPPPFWAFAWAGGQALARYVLDHPELVAGRTVLDLATGSGLVAIAAARAGGTVTANDIDPLSLAATEANAAANGVRVTCAGGDLLDGPPGADVLLAGDVCYSREMTARVMPFLRRAAAGGALVLLGDPGRAYLPREGLTARAAYDVPVTEALESTTVRHTTVWQV
ncbi:class I SAM-dependent methyltransferase [Spirilliplanes yamanashiensis]|uniref:Ribosomal protein L11 methyltransferase n=1 Tax=Spirilliplanes yamanashiensis TaxID=42233 RepID=A0A8J3Y5L3_9ACTN|nr:50S ribosomal protein L11 methyltransferase [Spirilliplanes yamanashiensis]MDP9819426.1 putative nicotinamide N-methyase [Spirilliplanes yamanashiensis]GIJ01750.1 ribosomal protein L11 methyltransferase [Spirilliplanes yamanashiensis]